MENTNPESAAYDAGDRRHVERRRPTTLATTQSQGFWHGNRGSSSARELYLNGTLIDSSVDTSVVLPDQSICALSFSFNGGVPGFPSSDQIAVVGFGGTLNSLQATSMYAAVQAYMTAMGSQV